MSFRLTSQFQIGNYQFSGGVNQVEIKRSVKDIVDTAVITMPALVSSNSVNMPNSSIKTSTLFNEGDPVVINLGYNFNNVQEFKGFVRRVNASIPVKIECEGYAWQLRRQRMPGSWPSIQLKEYLQLLVQNTNIQLSQYIPDYQLTNLKSNRKNCLDDLEFLRDHCYLSVYFLFDTLFVGSEDGVQGAGATAGPNPAPIFQLGWNTFRDDKLKWRKITDNPLLVRMVASKGNNKQRPVYTYGTTGGSVVTDDIANVSGDTAINSIAQDTYNKACYTGYEGSITGFLQPYVQMCDTANLQDPLYKVRQGAFFTQGTNVKFGVGGATREIFLGQSIGPVTPATDAS
jgi:hypothetical protein